MQAAAEQDADFHWTWCRVPLEEMAKRLNAHPVLGVGKQWTIDSAERARREAIIAQEMSDRAQRMELARVHGTHSGAEWRAICEVYRNRCVRCGMKRPLTRDHIIPVSRDGTDSIANIQPLCRSCNSAKHRASIDYRAFARHVVSAARVRAVASRIFNSARHAARHFGISTTEVLLWYAGEKKPTPLQLIEVFRIKECLRKRRTRQP